MNDTDDLTGLQTHKVFPTIKLPASGMFGVVFDIAGLTWVNQNFGLEQGDRTLVSVADLLVRMCIQYETLPIRYAGDEFLILLKSLSAKDVHDFALTTIKACASLRLPFRQRGNSRTFVALNAAIVRVFPDTLLSPRDFSERIAGYLYSERSRMGRESGVIAFDDQSSGAQETDSFDRRGHNEDR